MNKQPQSTNAKPGPSPTGLPPHAPDETHIGSSGVLLLLGLGLLVCLVVAGIYSWPREQRDEGRAITESQRLKQAQENLHRLTIQIERYELDQLKKKRDGVCEDLKSVDKQLNAARDRAESLFFNGITEEAQQVIAESMKEIDLGKTMLGELTSELARCETALENGREACMEHVWLVESSSRGCSWGREDGYEQSALGRLVLKELELELEELELQRDQLVLVSHPNLAKVLTLRSTHEKPRSKSYVPRVPRVQEIWVTAQKMSSSDMLLI